MVLSGLDRSSHQFWRHVDSSHPAHDPDIVPEIADALLSVYMECDYQVGRLIDLLDDEDTFIIISDHGFGPAKRTFYLNDWLKQEGFLNLKSEVHIQGMTGRSKLFGSLAKPLFWLNNNLWC